MACLLTAVRCENTSFLLPWKIAK